MNIVVAILIFSVIVIIHELGHFLLAKTNGIGVTEFSVGMGPRLFTLVKTDKGITGKAFASGSFLDAREEWKDKTRYSLKLLPIGGSCMMLGEDEEIENPNAFNSKSVYARISVIFAGPFFNFLLAFLMSLIIISMNGYDPANVLEVENGMPMSEAGFKEGDVITKINNTSIHFQREIGTFLQFNPLTGEKLSITYERNGKEHKTTVTPVKVENEQGKQIYRLGFSFGGERVKVGILPTIKYSFHEVKYWIVTTVKSLGLIVKGKIHKDDLAGPVGIVNMVGDVIDETKEFGVPAVIMTLMNFAILISANIGVMNLLPIPALDGGRLLFLVIEWVRGKPANREVEGWINVAGFVALMVLMVFVMFNDISKLF